MPYYSAAGNTSFVCMLEACMEHLVSLVTNLSQKLLAACMAILAWKKIPKLNMLSRGESALCLCHASYSFTGRYSDVPETDSSFLPFNAWIHFFRLLLQYIPPPCFWSAVNFFSPFKLKTILLDLKFQNQSFMVLIYVIWHLTISCSC